MGFFIHIQGKYLPNEKCSPILKAISMSTSGFHFQGRYLFQWQFNKCSGNIIMHFCTAFLLFDSLSRSLGDILPIPTLDIDGTSYWVTMNSQSSSRHAYPIVAILMGTLALNFIFLTSIFLYECRACLWYYHWMKNLLPT